MTTQLYDLTIPVFIRSLTALSAILEKGRAFAEAEGIDPVTLTNARLIADMGPLTAQIQRATDSAKGAAVRLSGMENVAFEDDEVTFEDMKARVEKTIALLQSVPRETIDGKEDADVTLKTPSRDIHFKGRDYVLGFALPNFFFHVTTAYALLRQHGVPVGKLDYLGTN